MPLTVVYPADYFKPYQPDESFADEAQALASAGCQLLTWDHNGLHAKGGLQPGKALYRGWMMTQAEYAAMVTDWARQGWIAHTPAEAYGACHYLHNAYPLLTEFTPQTQFVKEESELVETLEALNWPGYFLKDAVKSLKTAQGSMISEPEAALPWLQSFRHYRGQVEWPLSVRQLEDWQLDSECRWFVWKDKAWGPQPDLQVPEPVAAAQERLNSPFFSVDVVRNREGQWRLIEVGDGQVSDRVGWSLERFVEMLTA